MKKLFFCLFLSVLTFQVSAQNYQLHAVYMYQFTKYIKWPASGSSEFVIGVLGDTPAIEYLDKMAQTKKAGSKDIVIKKFKSLSGVTKTDMLFVGKEADAELSNIINKVKGQNTLLITEEEGFGLEGSNINFVERNGRLVFELNQKAMERESLKVSAELAKLAIVI
ncbi:YfiR family protein [Fulvivirga sp. RKSG066]|uniref:YfiR family protein n=1 Tax=Fulvivirga aurantia TaxID=2529383 RepID=UPI0012BD3AB5|nr:YfiR family protein [Fulvivirga aurantia]MTI22732.1 YfiR family protein [Fulvivirga aurantia]